MPLAQADKWPYTADIININVYYLSIHVKDVYIYLKEIYSAFQKCNSIWCKLSEKKVIAYETRSNIKIHDFLIKPGGGWTPYPLITPLSRSVRPPPPSGLKVFYGWPLKELPINLPGNINLHSFSIPMIKRIYRADLFMLLTLLWFCKLSHVSLDFLFSILVWSTRS